jgi:predicted RNA polymerase sigma factor
VLAGSQRLFDVANVTDVAGRLPAALRALYLLFNESYHGACAESAVRAELCEEAIRLLLEHPATATPAAHALAALMRLHAARLPGRLDDYDGLHPFAEQDRSRWNRVLVAQGQALLERSATKAALALARNPTERRFYSQRITACAVAENS